MKIAFSDFWWKFDPNRNFFLDSAKRVIEGIEVTNNILDADVLFFSCYSKEHLRADRSKTKKIYFTGENTRPPLDDCDWSISFDFDTYGGKNFRLPLWMLQIDWWGTGGYINPQYVIPLDEIENNKFRSKTKNKFCSTVFNRDHLGNRRQAIIELSKYKPVECYGEPWGNWFYGEDVKLDVISNYKFTLCYENTSFPGYFTEKPIHARSAGCIPIYWSGERFDEDFNTKSFIHLSDFSGIADLVEEVKRIDSDDNLRLRMVSEPVFKSTPTIQPFMSFFEKALK
jgi:hypothetical protein